MRTFLATVASVATLMLTSAVPAQAHRGHAGLTVVEIDPVVGSVLVVHRFYAHDVEPTLVVLAPEKQPSLDDPEAFAALKAHLVDRFRIDIDGVRVPLRLIGETLAGDNVRVDFGGEWAPRPIREVRVDQDFFADIYDDMEMQVNVRVAGVTRTALFRPGVQAQTLTFEP